GAGGAGVRHGPPPRARGLLPCLPAQQLGRCRGVRRYRPALRPALTGRRAASLPCCIAECCRPLPAGNVIRLTPGGEQGMHVAASSEASAGTGAAGSSRLLPLVIALFFAWGFCTVLVDVLIPKLKATFSLGYAEAMLTQFCFFLAYFIVSIPAALLVSRIGYMRGIVLGLVVMASGCLMFSPAASMGWYPAFLAALFVLAAGITVVQVAANPLAAGLGDPARSHSRLTLAQA